jgi:hypothetical protein
VPTRLAREWRVCPCGAWTCSVEYVLAHRYCLFCIQRTASPISFPSRLLVCSTSIGPCCMQPSAQILVRLSSAPNRCILC